MRPAAAARVRKGIAQVVAVGSLDGGMLEIPIAQPFHCFRVRHAARRGHGRRRAVLTGPLHSDRFGWIVRGLRVRRFVARAAVSSVDSSRRRVRAASASAPSAKLRPMTAAIR